MSPRPDAKLPADPTSPLMSAALATKELYDSYRAAGFEMHEALRLIAYQLKQDPPAE